MRALVLELMGGTEVLAGTFAGRRLFDLQMRQLPKVQAPELFAIDFSGVAVATASFLREGVVFFRDRVRGTASNIYPIVANPNAAVIEELVGLLEQMGEAIWSCTLKGEKVQKVTLLGTLEGKLASSLEEVAVKRSADATSLWSESKSSEAVGITTWNNRLAALSRKGLVIETRRGKQKIYSDIANGKV